MVNERSNLRRKQCLSPWNRGKFCAIFCPINPFQAVRSRYCLAKKLLTAILFRIGLDEWPQTFVTELSRQIHPRPLLITNEYRVFTLRMIHKVQRTSINNYNYKRKGQVGPSEATQSFFCEEKKMEGRYISVCKYCMVNMQAFVFFWLLFLNYYYLKYYISNNYFLNYYF